MSIPNPAVWAFRNLISASGRRMEVRISRNETYKYGVDHPEEVIYVDDMVFPKEHWGLQGMEEFDEDGDMTPLSWNFGVSDQFNFSGVLGDSTVITLQNLQDNNTSLIPWIINDFSLNARGKFNSTFYVWKSWIAADGSVEEIYYSGTIDLSKISRLPFLRNKSMTVNAFGLDTWKIQTDTISDILSKLYVQDLVENISQSDLATSARKAWYNGLVWRNKNPNGGYPRTDEVSATPGTAPISANGDFVGHLYPFQGNDNNQDGFDMAGYTYDNLEIAFDDRTNVYGVKHGFQGISYTAMVSKIATLGNFIFDLTNSDQPFAIYAPHYNDADGSDNYDLSPITDTYLPNVLCKNYNILFGVRPDEPGYRFSFGTNLLQLFGHSQAAQTGDWTTAGLTEYRNITGITNASPAVIQLDTAPDLPLHVGQNFSVFGAVGNTAVNLKQSRISTIIDDTHITIEDETGTPINGNGTWTSGGVAMWVSAEYYDTYSTPSTIARDTTLGAFLEMITHRFNCLMEWDIQQSGANIGKPILLWRDVLNCETAAPTKWADANATPKILNGSEIQNVNLPKSVVKLTSLGDTSAVYCPRRPRVGEQVIERQIMTRYKKWGEYGGWNTANFINDRRYDVKNQNRTYYNTEDNDNNSFFNIAGNGTGYLCGAGDFYYYSGSPGIYPCTARPFGYASFINSFLGSTGSDQSGFYSVSYEEYHGDTSGYLPAASVNKDYFNPLVKKAIVLANALLVTKTTDIRVIRGITDDSGSTRKLLRRLKTSWRDEFGNIAYKRASKVFINEFADTTTVHFLTVKVDDTIITDLPYVIDDGEPGTGGPLTGGNPVGSGGTGDVNSTDFLLTKPNSIYRNTTQPTDDTFKAHEIRQHSATQSAHLLDITDSDGTNILSGIDEAGSFFSNLQKALSLLPYGTGAGNTGGLYFGTLAASGKFVIMKAADSMSADWTLTLPPNDGNENGLLRTDGNGVTTFIPIANLISAGSSAIVLSETGTHTVVINIGTIDLTSLQTVSDQTILGNDSGGTSQPYALTPAEAREVLGVSNLHVHGGTIANPAGVATGNYVIWRAPYACTVTNVRGYRSGGSGATINARKNGTSNHLASALSLTSADTWQDGGSVSNTSYAAGDKMEIMVVSVTGAPTEIAIQVDIQIP